MRRQLAGRLAEIGDTDEALIELRRIHDVYSGLGAALELEKTRMQFREIGQRPPPRPVSAGVAGLTARELEVARLVAVSRERTLGGDLVNFVYLDGIEARRLAHAGSAAEGAELGRKAAATADTTDNFDVRAHAWYALTETLCLAGDLEEASRAATTSIEIRLAKGDVAGAAALERRYATLGL